VLARARLAQAASAEAIELVEAIRPTTLEALPLRVRAHLTLGHAHGSFEEPDTGRELIAGARKEAEQQGWPGLVFEARLALTAVAVVTTSEGAADEVSTLAHDANHEGYGRIVRLAKTLTER
nr:hypothetical protein [Myxococcota bacterium]